MPSVIEVHTRPYQKLIVWKEAHKLCLWVYKVTQHFPSEEKFGLVAQMRRSAASVPTNIAEGSTKSSEKERLHFYEIAKTSLEELHYQCFLSKELQYLSFSEYEFADQTIQKISYLLMRLRSSLRP